MLEKMAKQILAEFNERGFDGFILDYKASDPLTRCNIIKLCGSRKESKQTAIRKPPPNSNLQTNSTVINTVTSALKKEALFCCTK